MEGLERGSNEKTSREATYREHTKTVILAGVLCENCSRSFFGGVEFLSLWFESCWISKGNENRLDRDTVNSCVWQVHV